MNNNNDFLSLPVYKHQTEITKNILNPDIKSMVIIGETGSGKTTQIPKIIYSALGENNCKICITQPRRVAAISVAIKVSSELKSRIGHTVGYSVRFEEKTSINTKIKYVTDGMLLRECILDNSLSSYNVIIIDEIHERSINTDTLLALIKNIQSSKNKNLKLIVMSATIDEQVLLKYLNTNCLIKIKGRTFPIKVYHSLENNNNYIDAAAITILQIHLYDNKEEDFVRGDILVFLPGQEDIEDLYYILENKNKIIEYNNSNDNSYTRKLAVFQIFSNLPHEEQMKVFQPVDSAKFRKVILSTNIAETSLTIKNIKYVIDCGYFKCRTYNYIKNLDSLNIEKISNNSAIQRSGRAGRESSGKCFRLYTESFNSTMNETIKPEILRSNLIDLIILIKSIGYNNLEDLEFIDLPKRQDYNQSIEELKLLKALDFNENLTELGRRLSILPVIPSLGKVLLNAFFNDDFFQVQDDVISLVSLLQSDNIFYCPGNQREKVDYVKNKFANNTSDHLTLLNIYRNWKEAKCSSNININNWASENYINLKSLTKAEEIKKQLVKYLINIKSKNNSLNKNKSSSKIDALNENILDINLHNQKISKFNDLEMQKYIKNRDNLILICFVSGYISNIAKYDSDNTFITDKGKHRCRPHPSSIVNLSMGLAKNSGYLLYSEVFITSKQYLKNCSIISKSIIDNSKLY